MFYVAEHAILLIKKKTVLAFLLADNAGNIV